MLIQAVCADSLVIAGLVVAPGVQVPGGQCIACELLAEQSCNHAITSSCLMLETHLVIVRQLLARGNVALGVYDNVLVPLDSNDLGVAVGFTGVVDEACQTPLHSQRSSAIRRASCSGL